MVDIFTYLNTVSIPIIVTDNNNKVLFKNIVAGKSFNGIRLNSYMSTYFMHKSDKETLDTFCDENIPIVLTLTLVGYTLCCLVTKREIEGETYRFYTVAPFMYELFEKKSDDESALKFMKDYEEHILSYIRYMNDRLDGKDEKIAAQLKGRIRASAKRILYYADRVRLSLGVPNETLSNNFNFKRILYVRESVKALLGCFNEISAGTGDECLVFNENRDIPKIKICANSIVFGRLFTYMAFLSLKYCFHAPEVSISVKDKSVYINFAIGTTSHSDTELFSIDCGYLKAYAQRNDMTVGVENFSRKTVMFIRIDGIDTDNNLNVSQPIIPYGGQAEYIRMFYEEIAGFFNE